MKLQEFIEQYDTNDFLKRSLEEMNESISMLKNIHEKEFENHLRRANSLYYCIYGYTYAVYHYGDISFDDRQSLVDELMELFKFWK